MPKRSYRQDDCLPPQVLQINNRECPTLFHKVTIPAEIGDDKTNPPRNGQYRNVLLVYEANKHVYMFSSDGIPTLISDGGQGVDDYNELTNKPSIEGHELVGDSSLEDIGVIDAIEEALEDYTPTSDLAEVAFSGDYDDLENTPTPPVTHFYHHGSGEIEDPFPFYNDAAYTDRTTYQQFEDAILSGPVQVLDEYDAAAYMIGNVEMVAAETGYNVAFWVSGEKERQVFRWVYTDSAPVLESVESYSYQPDWNVSNPNSFAYIRNKPTIPTVNNATLTIQKEGSSIGTFTSNSATNTTVNIVETDPTVPSWAKQPTKPTYSYSEITNKPTIPTKTSDLTNDGSDGTSTYVEDNDLATVATSGSYNDLSDKPTIPAAQVNSDWNAASGVAQILNKPTLATVATSGSYNDLTDKPDIPSGLHIFYMLNPSVGNAAPIYHDYRRTDQVTLAQFTDAIASGPVQIYMEYDGHTFRIHYVDQMDAFIPDPPMATGTLYVSFGLRDQYGLGVRRFLWYEPDTAPIFDGYDSNQSDWNETSSTNSSYIKNKPNLAAVATSGSYNDLSNKPTIPAAQVNSDWNAASGVAEILNKPTIPTVNDATLTITQNGASAGTFTANASSNTTINLTDTTYSNFGGATSSAAGASGLVPTPAAGDQTKYLMGDGTWGEVQLPPSRTVLYVRTNLSYLTSPFYIYKDSSRTTPITWDEMRALLNAEDGGEVVIRVMDSSDSTYCIVSFEHDMAWFGVIDASQEHDSAAIYHFHEDYDDSTRSKFVIEKQEIGGGLTELSYGNSTWSDFITAYKAGKIVYCRASSNANPASGSQTRKAFMAYVNNAESPTSVEFQYVRSVSSKTASQPVDQVLVYTLTNANGGTWTVKTRDMGPKLAAGTNTTVSYSNGTYTISATGGGGGGGPTVVQTTGQSTTDVMSQKAVTDIIGNVETILQTLNSGNGAQQ